MKEKSSFPDKYITKLHAEILMIMDEVDRVCRANHLHYFLFTGSCLGAIRHQGFIPWDDDMDIVMPRTDFNRFIEIMEKRDNTKAGDFIYLRWITTEKHYNLSFAKICLKGTLFQEHKGKAAQNSGIFVDVFPMDSCQAYGETIERKFRIFQTLKNILYNKGSEETYIRCSIKRWCIKVFANIFSNKIIHKMMLWIISSRGNSDMNYYAVYASPYPIKRTLVPQSWYGEGKEAIFEDRIYICPFDAESCSKQLYGVDYMQLPPENKRKTHFPIRVVFSDGEEMEFKKVEKKIKHNDVIN